MSSIAQIPPRHHWQKLALASLLAHALVLAVPLKQALEERFFIPSQDGLSVILQTRPAPKTFTKPSEPLPKKELAPKAAPKPQEVAPALAAQPLDQLPVTNPGPQQVNESDFKHYEHPLYPRIARLQGLQGTVQLALWTKGAGHTVGRVEVVSSSGYPILDEAALTAAKKWVFGRPIDPSIKLTKRVIFKLED